jgi:hypothetical protein
MTSLTPCSYRGETITNCIDQLNVEDVSQQKRCGAKNHAILDLSLSLSLAIYISYNYVCKTLTPGSSPIAKATWVWIWICGTDPEAGGDFHYFYTLI